MEIILVLVLMGVMAAVIIPTLQLGVKSYTQSETRGDLASQARQSATRMIREIRNIQKEANNTPNITAADATSITYIFKLCAWLPLLGMLAIWLPDMRRSQ